MQFEMKQSGLKSLQQQSRRMEAAIATRNKLLNFTIAVTTKVEKKMQI
jgi:hypothetical protein